MPLQGSLKLQSDGLHPADTSNTKRIHCTERVHLLCFLAFEFVLSVLQISLDGIEHLSTRIY